jgi:hypothetical protein
MKQKDFYLYTYRTIDVSCFEQTLYVICCTSSISFHSWLLNNLQIIMSLIVSVGRFTVVNLWQIKALKIVYLSNRYLYTYALCIYTATIKTCTKLNNLKGTVAWDFLLLVFSSIRSLWAINYPTWIMYSLHKDHLVFYSTVYTYF